MNNKYNENMEEVTACKLKPHTGWKLNVKSAACYQHEFLVKRKIWTGRKLHWCEVYPSN